MVLSAFVLEHFCWFGFKVRKIFLLQINFCKSETFLSTKYYGVFTAVVIAVNMLYDTWKMADDRNINGVRNKFFAFS